MNITSTHDVSSHHVKILVHGPPGSGKTRLVATLPGKALILSAEAGLLSLADEKIDTAEIKTIEDLREAYAFLKRGDHDYQWVCIDSISEIAEIVLHHEMDQTTNGMRAYGEMAKIVFSVLRNFRGLPMGVYMTAKQEKTATDGGLLFSPMLPGKQLSNGIGHIFDEIFAMRVAKNEDGTIRTALLTQNDGQYEAKDRSGKLETYEQPNLAAIVAKIQGSKK